MTINVEMINDFKKKVNGANPFFSKYIVQLASKSEEILSLDYLIETYKKIVEYKQVIKNQKINIFTFENFDDLNDELDSMIYNHENKKFMNKFFSNKYKSILNKKSYQLFALLRENNVDIEVIKDRFISGMAALKETRTFNFQLEKFVNEIVNFSNDHIMKKVEKENAEVIFVNDKFLAVYVKDFEASKALGSSRWCISRSESSFKSYSNSNYSYGVKKYKQILEKYGITNRKTNRYIFLYDFTKDSYNSDYLIGYTLSPSGNILYQFDANNRVYKKNAHVDLLQEIQMNYLNFLNKEVKEIDFDKVIKEITNLKDKIEFCESFAPEKLSDLYIKDRIKLKDKDVFKINDFKAFSYFKQIDTINLNVFIEKFKFLNTQLMLECFDKLNIDDVKLTKELLQLLNKYYETKTIGKNKKGTINPLAFLNLILKKKKINWNNWDNKKSIYRFIAESTIDLESFKNLELSITDDILIDLLLVRYKSYGSYSFNSKIKLLAKVHQVNQGKNIDVNKLLKQHVSADGMIKTLLLGNEYKFKDILNSEIDVLLSYLNYSKAIKILSDEFSINQARFLKEFRNQDGVRYYNYNRNFFENLMDNWSSANITRYKMSNAEQVVVLLLNYHEDDEFKKVLSWVKNKKEELLNERIFINNRIYGKTIRDKELTKLLSFNESVLIPNINQLSFISLFNKKEKEKMLHYMKKVNQFDTPTLHNAIKEIVSVNGDDELLNLFVSIYQVDTRDAKDIFMDMMINHKKYKEEDMMIFIETHHTELRKLLRSQTENGFLKIIARYL